jgi:hypothetical protein
MSKAGIVLAGFGCKPESWQNWLKQSPQQDEISFDVFNIFDYLEWSKEADIRKMASAVCLHLQKARPPILIMHDFGVTIGLMALLKLKKRGDYFPQKIILLNGAFRGFDVLKSRHPFTMQIVGVPHIEQSMRLSGGTVDPRFKTHLSQIRQVYRQVILASLLFRWRKPAPIPLNFACEVNLVLSQNDPYIPIEALHQLVEDLSTPANSLTVTWHQYRHFPYSGLDASQFFHASHLRRE